MTCAWYQNCDQTLDQLPVTVGTEVGEVGHPQQTFQDARPRISTQPASSVAKTAQHTLGTRHCTSARAILGMAKRKRPDHEAQGTKRTQPSTQGTATSAYRGVTLHARTGRYEAHVRSPHGSTLAIPFSYLQIWWQRRQLFLGSFSTAARAATAFDLASIKLRGRRDATPPTNFPLAFYQQELQHRASITNDALVQSLRAQSKRLQHDSTVPPVDPALTVDHIVAIAKALDGPDVQHLVVFGDEMTAAMAYDRAAIAQLGWRALTNFDLSCYQAELGQEQYAIAQAQGLLGTKPLPHGWSGAGLI